MADTVRWTSEIQIGYPQISEVALAPNGRVAVFVGREPLLTNEKSEFLTHLYLAADHNREPRQLTFGEHCNSAPSWSPDGAHLAFLSTRSGRANVYVMRADGGEAWALTHYEKTDVVTLRWAPDGQSIAFLMAEPHSEDKEKSIKAKNDMFRWEVDLDFAQLYSVPFAVGPRQPPEVRQITRGRQHVVAFDWFPDAQTLAILQRPTPVEETWPQTHLAMVRADGSAEPEDIALVADAGASPRVSPDGRWIACGTGDQPISWAFSNRIVLYPVGGSLASSGQSEPRPLAATADQQSLLIGWSGDGSVIYALDNDGVSTQIWELPASGAPARQITTSQLLKTAPMVNNADRLAFVGEDFDQPNAVYLLDPATGQEQKFAAPALPAGWPKSPLPAAEVIQWPAPDGQIIEGILVYPVGYEPGQRCPLVVAVHGGPSGVYQRTYLAISDQYADIVGLAERGYAILRANPRGSSGYGKAFRFANGADWGGGDYQDIMAGIDHLIARGIADADRLGIMGWSYGGFMTSWTITQTNRFKAACVGAGVTNLISFNGTSDIPSFLPDYFGAETWDDLEHYQRHSPILQAKGVKTPTLIQHGDADIRVPLSQGRELYNVLKRQGTPVELVIYPRQGHWFGEPRMFVDLQRRAFEWLVRWIGA